MSSTLTKNILSLPATFARTEPDSLFDEFQSLPGRVPITREMACLLVEHGLLTERYPLHDGTLYADSHLIQRLPITHEMFYDLYNANLVDEKTELLEGVIIAKMPQNKPHLTTLMLLQEWLISLFGFRLVRDQYPVDIDIANKTINTPEPDILVLNNTQILFAKGNPTPNDVLLSLEVADSTIRKDKVIKAELHEKTAIQEYWIADTNARTIIVHREPENGTYQSVVIYTLEQKVSCLAKPDDFKNVDELIAPNITENEPNTQQ